MGSSRALFIHTLQITLALSCLVALGCGRSHKGYDQSRRSFSVTDVRGEIANQSPTQSEWDLVSQRLVNFSACMIDGGREGAVANQKFAIEGGAKMQSVTSDHDGCVHWSEPLEFDLLADPTYVEVVRTLHPLDFYNDDQSIHIAVNLWSGLIGDEPAVVNLATNKVAKLLSVSAAGLMQKPTANAAKAVVINSVTYKLDLENTQADAKGLTAQMTLSFVPQIRLQTMSGETTLLPLKKGVFEVKPMLIHIRTDGSQEFVHQDIAPFEVSFDNANLTRKDINILFTMTPPQTGLYYLELVAMPLRAPSDMGQFIGGFRIGDWAQLAGSEISLDPTFQVKLVGTPPPSAGTPSKGVTGALPVNPAANSVAAIDLDIIRGRQDGTLDEDSVYRTIKINLWARVYSPATLRDLRGHKVTIQSIRDPRITMSGTVSDDGDLYWEDQLTYNTYELQHKMSFTIAVTDVVTGQTVRHIVDINPWVRSFIFLQDRRLQQGFIAPANPQFTPRPPLLRIEAQCLMKTETTPSTADNKLNLILNLSYNLEMFPMVFRYDDMLFGQIATEGLRPGKYLLTVLVYRDDLGRDQVQQLVSSYQHVIDYRGGAAVMPLTLPMSELGLVPARNYVVTQISHVDEAHSPKDKNGQFIAEQAQLVKGLALQNPVSIFPLVMPNEPCNGIVPHANFQDPRLRQLAEKLNQTGFDAHQAHRQRMREVAQRDAQDEAERIQREKQGYIDYARDYRLKLVEMSDAKALAEVHVPNVAPELFAKVLRCLEESKWQDKYFPALCQQDQQLTAVLNTMCYDVRPELSAAIASQNLPYSQRRYALNHMYQTCFGNPWQFFHGERQVHVYETGEQPSAFDGGFSSALTIVKAFNVGLDLGSEYMHEYNTGLKLDLTVSGKGSPFRTLLPADIQSAMSQKLVSALGKMADNKSVGENLKLSGSGFRRLEAFKWIFDYQIGIDEVSVLPNTQLTIDRLDMRFNLKRYRECFAMWIDPKIIAAMTPTATVDKIDLQGKYFCLPAVQGGEPKFLTERYYIIQSAAPTGGMAINSQDMRNRFFLVLRGQKDFVSFLTALRDSGSYEWHQAPTEVINQLNEATTTTQHILFEDDGILNIDRPSPDHYGAPRPGWPIRVLNALMDWFNVGPGNGAIQIEDQNDPSLRR
jgi:hypothetical protein